jgi:hypothetical protein
MINPNPNLFEKHRAAIKARDEQITDDVNKKSKAIRDRIDLEDPQSFARGVAEVQAVLDGGAKEMAEFITELTIKEFAIEPLFKMSETQRTISDWAEATFGPVGSNASVAARANREMSELIQALARDDNHPKAGEEVADIVICLMRLTDRLGCDLAAEIDRKMQINRARQWKLDGDGHGSHIDNPIAPADHGVCKNL